MVAVDLAVEIVAVDLAVAIVVLIFVVFYIYLHNALAMNQIKYG